MTPRTTTSPLVAVAVLAPLLATTGCDPSDSLGAGEDVIEVVTRTTGDDPDPDGYAYRVDGGSGGEGRIGPSATVVVEGAAPGSHRVALDDVAGNCAVDGDNPVEVLVPWNRRASFDVACVATRGDLRVAATTSGVLPDRDGYTVRVDGGSPRALPPDGQVVYRDLAAGTRRVALSDVDLPCRVGGDNPRDVEVPSGGEASTLFEVTCP